MQMTILGPIAAAEEVAKKVIASLLGVVETAINKAVFRPLSSARLLASASRPGSYTSPPARFRRAQEATHLLTYEVVVPKNSDPEDLIEKANKLPQTMPKAFSELGVTVTNVSHSIAPFNFNQTVVKSAPSSSQTSTSKSQTSDSDEDDDREYDYSEHSDWDGEFDREEDEDYWDNIDDLDRDEDEPADGEGDLFL